ncbi:hypothetical protein GGR56DRAFT_673432 [Xylariaceae sp. FL0804]|nr:hypothetical protein GGR56DRAFT_673432 [Xylariaceae sp. FL0804]
MPSRISLPTLSIFSRAAAPACSVFSPPSPASTSSGSSSHSARSSGTSTSASTTSSASPSASPAETTMISPPPRLHMRNVLPTTPDALPTPPPPPPQPRPWLWQCHSCYSVYRLGCTRRCLVCDHTYCVSAQNPNPASTSTTATSGRQRRRRRAAPPGMCAATFDFAGWREWGAWRRKVLGCEAAGRCEAAARDAAFARGAHDCALDCDSPSQCHHRRYEMAQEQAARQRAQQERQQQREQQEREREQERRMTGRPQMQQRRAASWRGGSSRGVASLPSSPDDDLPLNEARALTDIEEQAEPKSPVSVRGRAGSAAAAAAETKSRDKSAGGGGGGWLWPRISGGGRSSDSPVIDSQTLEELLAEDRDLMPMEEDDDDEDEDEDEAAGSPSPQGGPGRLAARNLTDRDIWEDCDLGSSSDDEDEYSDEDSDEDATFEFELDAEHRRPGTGAAPGSAADGQFSLEGILAAPLRVEAGRA